MSLNICTLAACGEPDNIPGFMWRHAKQREGAYVIHVDYGWGWLGTRYSVVLTEAEMRRLEPCIQNHKHRETQGKRAAQLIYQKAKDVWPTGKPEDLAMRTIAPWAICKYANTSSKGMTAYLRSEHLMTILGTAFLFGGYAIAKAIETTVFNGPVPMLETVFTRGVQALGAGGLAKGLYDGYKNISESAVELNLRSNRVSRFDRVGEYTDFLFGDGSSKNLKKPPGLDDEKDDSSKGPERNPYAYVRGQPQYFMKKHLGYHSK